MQHTESTKRIVFIGAAGEMCRVAIERFAKAAGAGDWKLELYDIRPETLRDFVKTLPAGSTTVGPSTSSTVLRCARPSTARISSCWARARTTAPQNR